MIYIAKHKLFFNKRLGAASYDLITCNITANHLLCTATSQLKTETSSALSKRFYFLRLIQCT